MRTHSRSTRATPWLALCVVLQGITATALAQSELELAESAYEAGQLDDASAQLQAALRTGALGPEQVARVYRLMGVLAVADGRNDDALTAFVTSLALAPAHQAPPELGPEQAAEVNAARESRLANPFSLTVEYGDVVRDAPLTLRVEAQNAPDDLIATFRVSASAPGAAPWTGDGAASSGEVLLEALAWRGADELLLTISARDRFGNTLARTQQELRAPEPEELPDDIIGVGAPPPSTEEPASPRGRRIALAIAGVVLIGAAVGVGVWLARRPVPTQFVLGAQ